MGTARHAGLAAGRAGRRGLAAVIAAIPLLSVAACFPRPEATEAYDPAAPAPLFPDPRAMLSISEAQARATLEAHGYANVSNLQRVGDYWQGDAVTAGGPVTVYLFNNGRIMQEPPAIGGP